MFNKFRFCLGLSLLVLLVGGSAQAHDIVSARTGTVVSTQISKSECVSIAHAVCDEIFGECAKSDAAAVGGEIGYLVIYQCHYVEMNVNNVVSMVIAGSRTENTNSAKMKGWLEESVATVISRFSEY